jgi:hypothetical protein
VSVTLVGGIELGTFAVHPAVEPVVQEMPSAAIVPRPVPEVFAVRSQVAGPNEAVTDVARVTETVQTLPDTEVQPYQLVKTDPASAVAVSVTLVGGIVLATFAVHPAVEPVVQAMPGAVTVPRPVPEVFVVRSQVAGPNDAVTLLAPAMETTQTFPEMEVQPLQLEKTEPASAVAVRVTLVAGVVFATLAVHPAVEPVVQVMPGAVTVPRPVPEVFAVRSHIAGPNDAVTDLAPAIETVQTFPEMEVQPLQLEKTEPASAVAVSVTLVAGVVFATLAVHPAVEPVVQVMPGAVTVLARSRRSSR